MGATTPRGDEIDDGAGVIAAVGDESSGGLEAIDQGHALLDEIEAALVAELPGVEVTTHLEPMA